jgi:hypothetical protein
LNGRGPYTASTIAFKGQCDQTGHFIGAQ